MLGRISFLLFVLISLLNSSLTAAVVGLTQGDFRVDESGAATYNIPIKTPTGRAGVTPQVSLSYSSNNLAEGPVGVGWSISGLSSISRCPQVPIYDAGNIREVKFDTYDKFCIDGQRLLLESGVYGENDSTYRTEVDNFSVITAKNDTSTNGPLYFIVTNKAGETHYYGDASSESSYFGDHSDAFIEPGGYQLGSLARSWALKVIKDKKENYILYNYNKGQDLNTNIALGTLYIDKIQYTGNLATGDAPYAEIKFVYNPYNKGFKGYMAGAHLYHNQLLARIDTTIDTTIGGSAFRSYFLNYENSDFIEERTLLTSVQECNDASATTCLPITQFDWQRSTPSNDGSTQTCVTVPYNFCWYQPSTTNFQAFTTVDNSLTTGTANHAYAQVFDINGDGYQDLVYVSGSNWKTKLGPGFGTEHQLTSIGDTKKEYALNIDYNGDGVRDLLVADSKTTNWYAVSYQPTTTTGQYCPPYGPCQDYTNTTSVSVQDLNIVATGLEGEAQVMDVNGDGMEDIVFHDSNYLKAHINNGDGTFTSTIDTPTATIPGHLHNFSTTVSTLSFNGGTVSQTANMKSASAIDINGDGRSDIILRVTTGTCSNHFFNDIGTCTDAGGSWSVNTSHQLFVSSGQYSSPTLTPSQTIVSSVGYNSLYNNFRVADLNGDGLSDLLFVVQDKWLYRLSNGLGFLSPRETNLTTSSTYKYLDQFVDLNGDGRTDMLLATSTSSWDIYFSRPTTDGHWVLFEKRGSQSFDANATVRFGDTFGDGKLNMLTATGSTWKEYSKRQGTKEYVIDKIINGHGVATKIAYKPMTDTSVYVVQASDDDINSDTFSPVIGMQLVSRVTTDINTNNTVAVSYQYGGLLIHKKGRGSLGFEMLRTTTQKSDENGIVSDIVGETHYNQSHDSVNFAKARMPEYSEQRINGVILSSATNTLSVKTTRQGGSMLDSVLPYISQSIENSYVYGSNGVSTHINSTATTNDYDNWGNLTDSTIIVTDSATANTIETITTNNFGTAIEEQYGRLKSATVQKKRTGDIGYTTRDTVFTYNTDMLLETSTVSPNSPATKLVTTYGYDAYGNKSSISVTGYSTAIGSNQTRLTTNDYDGRGRYLNYKENAFGERVTYLYNGATADAAVGITTSLTETDPNNISTISQFDSMGRLISIDHPDSRFTNISTTLCVDCVTGSYYKIYKTVSGSPDTEVYFDRWGRQILSQIEGFDGNWIATQMTYDNQGRQFRVYEPGSTSYYTEFTYDELDRVTQVTKPNSQSVTSGIYGLESRTTNELGQVSSIFSNGFGETDYTVDAKSNQVKFTYDTFSNLLESMTSVGGKDSKVNAEYDTWGRKTKTIDPIKGTWTYSYNAFGELYTQTTARSHTFTFNYDLLGRKVRSYEPYEGTLCWNYGSVNEAASKASGKIISTAKYEGSDENCSSPPTATIKKAFTYNGLGLPQDVITTIGSNSYTQTQDYDMYSRPSVTTYPFGTSSFAVRNEYNPFNYLFEIHNDASNALYKRIDSMTDRLQVEQVTLGNNVTSLNGFRADMGWLSSINVADGGSTLNDIQVTYDAVGNVKTRKSDYAATGLSGSHYTETYNYDNLNRLNGRTISITSGGASLPSSFTVPATYTLDDWGNFKFKTEAGHYKYDSTVVHKLLGVYSDYDGSTYSGLLYAFAYDCNGNITTDANRNFTYGSFDKPTYMSKVGASSMMKYGVSRELYSKIDSYEENGTNVTYQTTYLGGYEKVERTGGNGNLTEHKYYVGDIIVTQRSDMTTDTNYLHKDHQGSVVAITDQPIPNQNVAVISQAIYDPFGQRTAVYLDTVLGNFTYSEPTDRGYTGHKHIAAFDIIHMGGRIYDPTLGRFMQADPIVQFPKNSQSYNRFSYVLNNPMTYTDPSGYGIWETITRPFKKLGRSILSALGSKVSGWLVKIGSAWCGPYYAACVAGGNYEIARSQGASSTGALKAGATAGVMAYVGQQANAEWGPGEWESIATQAVAGGIVADLNGGKFGHGFASAGFNAFNQGPNSEANYGSGLSSPGDYLSSLGNHVTNAYAQDEMARFAKKNGMTLTQLNILLTLNSFAGNAIAGSRYSENDNSMLGVTKKSGWGVWGILWDINDIALGYQGYLDASAFDYIISDNVGSSISYCHSLGSLTCNNLVARGFAPSANLNSLPIGNVAYGPNQSMTRLGRWDIVNGGFLGTWIFNWGATVTDCVSFSDYACHGQGNYQ